MKTFFKNNILTRTLVGFFAILLFMLPVLVSIDSHVSSPTTLSSVSSSVHIDIANAYAEDVVTTVGYALGDFLLTIGASFAWLGGVILEKAFDVTVLNMGKGIKEGGIGITINEIWGVIRDFSNLVFIFGFIYIGIRTILQPESANTKRFLAQLVIAALLINFSLFFTKVVIDVSNVFAVEIHQLFEDSGDRNIGFEIARNSGLAGLYDPLPPEELANHTTGGSIAFFLMGFLFLLVLAFVLAAGAIILVVRYVMLIFIMIFSPLLFAASVFPQTSKYSGQLFSALLKHAFFAPIFLFFLYISVRVLQTLYADSPESLSMALKNQSGTPTADSWSVLLQFVVAIMFVIASIKSAQLLSIAGGEKAVKMGNSLRGQLQGFAGRNLIGKPAEQYLKNFDKERSKNTRTSRFLRSTGLDRSIRGFYKAGVDAKFGGSQSMTEVRKIDKDNAAQYAKMGGVVELEEARKITDKKARLAATEKAVRDMSKAQFEEAGEKLLNNEEVMRYVSSSQMDDIMKSEEFNDTQKGAFAKTRGNAIEQLLKDTYGENKQLVEIIGKASIGQLEALGADRLTANADGLNSSQMDDLKKSKKFLETEVNSIKESRETKLWNKFEEDSRADPLSVFKDKKDKEVAKLPKEILSDPRAMTALTGGILRQIVESDSLTREERKKIRENIDANPQAAHSSVRKYFSSPHGQTF